MNNIEITLTKFGLDHIINIDVINKKIKDEDKDVIYISQEKIDELYRIIRDWDKKYYSTKIIKQMESYSLKEEKQAVM